MWVIFALVFRAISSVGSERLPYKQEVVGSIPTSPTRRKSPQIKGGSFFVMRSEGLFPELIINDRQRSLPGLILAD
jgi:hypothetical protein